MDSASALINHDYVAPQFPVQQALDKPFRHMDLPAEFRVLVYEYLVIVGKIFYLGKESQTDRGCRSAGWAE